MISDNAKVSLADGTALTAMELFPGRELLSHDSHRFSRTVLREKKVETSTDFICLILGSGQKLIGSRDQRVARWKNDRRFFVPMADIEIGDTLRGERAGMPVVVRVIGMMFFPKETARLVGLVTDKKRPFVAEGVLCLS